VKDGGKEGGMKALNLGCGLEPGGRGLMPAGVEVVCHDRTKHSEFVQVTHDLRQFPWPWRDGEFGFILAFDVIEHLPDTLATVDECWRILVPGGELYIHTNNNEFLADAMRDPTHVRYFGWESFDYFDFATRWGSSYGRFYTDKPWNLVEKQREGTELVFRLRKR
jgi:SAM-dependent methyltransferase